MALAPGETNNNIAFPLSPGLKAFCDSVPNGLYGLGDSAYTLLDHLMILFNRSQRNDPATCKACFQLLPVIIEDTSRNGFG